MLARAIFLFLTLLAGGYGLVYAITCTDYFHDAKRVRRIAGRICMSLVALAIAIFGFWVLTLADHGI